MCKHIYTYVHSALRQHKYMQKHIRVRMHEHAHKCTHIYAHKCTHKHKHTHSYKNACKRLLINTHSAKYTQIYTPKYHGFIVNVEEQGWLWTFLLSLLTTTIGGISSSSMNTHADFTYYSDVKFLTLRCTNILSYNFLYFIPSDF